MTNDGTSISPHDGWAGAWKRNNWKYIAFQRSKLEWILEHEGFDVKACLKTWKDRGWLQTDKSGNGKNVRINENTVYCYCLKKSVIEDQLGIDTEAEYDD
jgi:hypothetical protein